jgi:glutathione S-transferase
MKLYGHDTSPYVRRIRVLLAELGLPFTRDLNNWTSPDLPRVNPLMKVPVLEDEGRVILDSRLIADFLYDRAGGSVPPPPPGHAPLQPALWRPGRRYDEENVLLLIDGAADSAINVFLLERDGIDRAASPYLRRQMERVATCLRYLDGLYAESDTLAPGTFAFVDIALVCALEWMIFRERYDVRAHENLARVLDRHKDRPSLAETHPARAQTPPLPPLR